MVDKGKKRRKEAKKIDGKREREPHVMWGLTRMGLAQPYLG